jgi:hypothetical protein
VEQKSRGFTSLREEDILKAVVFMTRMAYGRANGRPKSRAFVEFLLQQFPDRGGAESEAKTGNIILP